MKTNLENTTVKDISYLINSVCLKAPGRTTLEKLADMLCTSDRYKVYLENDEGRLEGVIQAKQIAMKVLVLSRQKADEEEMLPAITYALNAQIGKDLAEEAVTVTGDTRLKTVLELMEQNQIREIAVVDADGGLVGTLEAKNILSHYLQAKAETAF
ncbi:MAG TPA: CBS domain-containing protein [Pontiella sp.]|nr:CBS domain-containing protein [Pontiella sp.]